MGDAGVSNVIYTTVPIVWGDKSLPAFGVFKEGFYLNSRGFDNIQSERIKDKNNQTVQMTATAISFGIAAEISLWVHMGIMIGLGVLAFTGYIFLRADF